MRGEARQKQARRRRLPGGVVSVRRLQRALALAVFLGLAAAPAASANLEWLGPSAGEFPNSEAEVVLESEPKGLAVNRATGDLYEADGSHNRVLRFNKEGKFLEGWGWGVGNGEAKFQRCGPEGEKGALGEPLYPTCPGREKRNQGIPGTAPDQFEGPEAVAVDPSNGNVFVADPVLEGPGLVREFTATGTFIRAFGPLGTGGGAQVEDYANYGFAVDSADRVYVVDNGRVHGKRVLEFDPESSGEYVYKRDLFTGAFGIASYLSVDDQGRFYVSDAAKVRRFDSPTATTPSWQLSVPETETETVDPATGEVLYYSLKQRVYHRVKPAGSSGGEDTTFAAAAGQVLSDDGAFNPDASLPGHPPGIFYAGEEIGFKPPWRGLIFAESAKFPPAVDGESAGNVGATFATLTGQIDPKGFATRYRFEYGTEGPCSASSCAEAPVGGGDAGEGTEDRGVSVPLSHLSPETTYFFRVVAENQFGVTEGASGAFRTYPQLEAALPDGRAYELVSPADKHGGEVIPSRPEFTSCGQCEPGLTTVKMPEQSAPDGESVVYEGFPFFPEAEGERGALKENEYRAARSATGWQTKDLSLEGESGGTGYRAFSPDLARSVLQEQTVPLAEDALTGYEELYVRDAGGTLTPLVQQLVEPLPAHSLEVRYAAGSSDLAHLVFEANQPLTAQTAFAPKAPAVAGRERDLYEWTAGALRLVNVLPGNASAAPGSVLGAGILLAVTGTGEPGPDRSNAVSTDGSKVFWTDLGSGKLYVREDGTSTREIPHTGRCRESVARSERVCFLTASADGSRVLLSNGTLYDTTAEPAAPSFDLTKGHHGFEGIAGASDDLSRIYFVDTEVINPVQGPLDTAAQAGQPNLYEYEAGASAVRFIATLQPHDNHHGVDRLLGTWVAAPEDRMAQVTPDGRFLAFDSVAPLTGYDNNSGGTICTPEGEVNTCAEVFEYDARARIVTCVSCNPTGLPPVGPSTLSLLAPVVSRYPQPHNLVRGGRVFFDSFDALTAGDRSPGVENVYEYEPAGQGSCTREGGCVFLLSSGRGTLDASFLDADESGENAFFTTRQQLLPEEDHDELVDLYDAREGGGFPKPPAPPAPCSGEACRPAPAPAPVAPPPASSTFFGPGNLVTPPPESSVQHATVTHPKKCPKGKLRRHGKCVKASKKRKHRAKKRSHPTHRPVKR